jgi:hypothetical protein
MHRKPPPALILSLIALALPSAIVKPTAARTGPSVGISCECIAHGRLFCQTEVYGGTAPYTYHMRGLTDPAAGCA